MRRVILLVVVVLVIAAVVVAFLHKSPVTEKINGPFYRTAMNLQQPFLMGSQLYFFTGSSFAKLDITTGQTTTLSDYFNVPGSVVVDSWTNNGVVFTVSGSTTDDIFGQVAQKAGEDPALPHWWRYDFNSRRLELIDFSGANKCTSVQEVGNNLYCFTPYQASSHQNILYSYDLATNSLKNVFKISGPVSLVSTEGSKLYYTTTDLSGSRTLWVFDTAGSSPAKTIYSSTRFINYVAGPSQILLSESAASLKPNNQTGHDVNTATTTATNQSLELVSVNGGKVIKKVSFVGINGNLSSSGSGLFFSLPTGPIYRTTATDIITEQTTEQGIDQAWQTKGVTYYLSSSKLNALLSNRQVPSVRGGDSFSESYNTPPNAFYVNAFSNGQNIVYLNNSSKDLNGNAQDVATFLTSIGFDPNQFDFSWQAVNIAPSSVDSVVVLGHQ